MVIQEWWGLDSGIKEMTDRLGAKTTGIIGMIVTMLPLMLGWLWADSFNQIILVGLMLGVAGASFAAALPLASRWYPPQYQVAELKTSRAESPAIRKSATVVSKPCIPPASRQLPQF